MKKYVLILTSLGILTFFGLTGFIKVEKSNPAESKKISYKVNHAHQLGLYSKPVLSDFENQSKVISDKAYREQLLQNISQLPLMFQKNMGQWQKEVLYRATTQDAIVGFKKNGITFFSSKEIEDRGEGNDEEDPELHETMVWNINFQGMNPEAEIVAGGEQPGITSYLLGNDSTKWIKQAPESRVISYENVYDRVDLHYYGIKNHKIEYDYVVKPQGKISNIVMELEGAGNLKINNKGELVITTPWGEVAEAKPYSYQMIKGEKKEVDVRYNILDDKTFGFKVYGKYNKKYDLVIDPKLLIWSTFLKGTQLTHYNQDIAIDGSKNSYIVGWTINNYDITPGVIQTSYGGGTYDGFVSKVNRWGTALLYSTYLGGSGEDRALGVAVNAAGNAFVTGAAETGFPTFNAAYATMNGSQDIFVSALNTAGTGFIYSSYFGGGSSSDEGRAIAVNSLNEVYVTGFARAHGTDFPTTAGAFLEDNNANTGNNDAFVLKLSSTGAVVWCTLLGSATSSRDEGYGITINSAGESFVVGLSAGSFPVTAGCFDNTNSGIDAFVAKVNSTGTALIYATYLGGTGADEGHGIAVRNDEAYVSGLATTGFPTTAGAFQTALSGGTFDSFVTKLNTTGTALVYSTYFGGTLAEATNDHRGVDIAVNNNGEAYFAGNTLSTNLPVGSAINGGFDLSYNGNDDSYIAVLNATGTALQCATYWGGASDDYKRISIALDLSSSLQDTLYGSVTTHTESIYNPPPDASDYPIAETQGSVYSRVHLSLEDIPAVFKMASCVIPPLPVELMTFKGSNKGDHNLLEWVTAKETNNDFFTLERSTDGVNFIAIGTIDGAGNSNSLRNYSYADQKEGDEIIYYRLKQTDIDGKATYSKVVVINAPETGKALELTIASPVTDYLTYRVCCLLKGDAKVEITEMSGKVVMTTNVQVNEGYNKLTLDVKNLAEGAYILKLISVNGTVSAKFVK